MALHTIRSTKQPGRSCEQNMADKCVYNMSQYSPYGIFITWVGYIDSLILTIDVTGLQQLFFIEKRINLSDLI